MKKRGAIEASFLVHILVSIVGLVVVLMFIGYFFTDVFQTDEELCRFSVLSRGTSLDAANRLLPLECTTKKICLTNGEDCKQFIGEKNVKKVKLPTTESDKVKTIEKVTADSIYNCWSMMGQGKIDLFGGGKDTSLVTEFFKLNNLQGAQTTCMICSRVALSEDVKESTIKEVDVNEYMQSNNIPGSTDTYLEAMTDRQVRAYPQAIKTDLANNANVKATREIGIVFMQILTEQGWFESGAETGAYTGSFVFAGTSTALGPFGGILSIKSRALLALGTALTTGSLSAFQTYQDRQLSASYCGDFTSVDDSFKGCSITTAFDYSDVESISKFCGKIEGNP